MRLAWIARPRTFLVPTLAGWAVLAAVVGAGALAGARVIPRFLAVDEPVGRGVLIVEGWMPREALDRAAEAARRGPYGTVFVTGGPIRDPAWNGGFETYAERAGAYLAGLDLGGRELRIVPAQGSHRDRTWESARALRAWLDSNRRRVDAADVFSLGPHARRSRDVFRLALGAEVAVGSRATPSPEYELERWWLRSEGARDVLGETVGYGWMLCCFWPGDGR